MTIPAQLKHLDLALEAILCVRVGLMDTHGPPMPDQALDLALRRHEGYQSAR